MKARTNLLLPLLGVAALLLQACAGGTPAPAAQPAAPAQATAKAEPAKVPEPAKADPTKPPAPTQAPAAKKLNVSYIVKMGDNPWFVGEAQGLKDYGQSVGMNVSVQDVQLDANLAMSAVDQAIGAGTDGIVIVAPDQKIGPAVLKKAADAKIPVVTIDDYLWNDAKKQAPFVGIVASEIGRQVGEKAAALYKASDWSKNSKAVIRTVSIQLPTLSVCMDRTIGAEEAWKKALPDFPKENMLKMDTDGTLKGAVDAFPAYITAHPEITHWILWSCNDDGVLGAVRALENAGVKADNIIGVGLAGHMACDEWNKGKPTGFKASVYINPAVHGKLAGQIMYEYLTKGTPLPENTIAQGTYVDPTNYKTTIVGCK